MRHMYKLRATSEEIQVFDLRQNLRNQVWYLKLSILLSYFVLHWKSEIMPTFYFNPNYDIFYTKMFCA